MSKSSFPQNTTSPLCHSTFTKRMRVCEPGAPRCSGSKPCHHRQRRAKYTLNCGSNVAQCNPHFNFGCRPTFAEQSKTINRSCKHLLNDVDDVAASHLCRLQHHQHGTSPADQYLSSRDGTLSSIVKIIFLFFLQDLWHTSSQNLYTRELCGFSTIVNFNRHGIPWASSSRRCYMAGTLAMHLPEWSIIMSLRLSQVVCDASKGGISVLDTALAGSIMEHCPKLFM